MQNDRRYFNKGDTVFITFVTLNRSPFLLDTGNIFRDTIKYVSDKLNSYFDAWVLLPDHVHFIISSSDAYPSDIVKRVKEKFARSFFSKNNLQVRRIWQQRFWDHIIRNEDDWRVHVDYIHYNPVKHGLTNDPFLWEHSSLKRYVEEGCYSREWGKKPIEFDMSFGE